MTLVVIESPYAGDIERNVKYARRCMKDSLARGEFPIASHLLYTQEGVLDDTKPEERAMGIDAGLRWGQAAASRIAFYVDYGFSTGMLEALDFFGDGEKEIVVRRIGENN
jgi:hypothetical protein